MTVNDFEKWENTTEEIELKKEVNDELFYLKNRYIVIDTQTNDISITNDFSSRIKVKNDNFDFEELNIQINKILEDYMFNERLYNNDYSNEELKFYLEKGFITEKQYKKFKKRELIDKEKVKDLLYKVKNEFENEIDDYTSEYKKNLDTNDINLMFEFLERYSEKIEILIEENEV